VSLQAVFELERLHRVGGDQAWRIRAEERLGEAVVEIGHLDDMADGCFLALFFIVYFTAIYGNGTRGVHTDFDTAQADFNNGDADVAGDDDLFADLAGEDEHVGSFQVGCADFLNQWVAPCVPRAESAAVINSVGFDKSLYATFQIHTKIQSEKRNLSFGFRICRL